MTATSSSNVHQQQPQHQVFINFRGELRFTFMSHLWRALQRERINVFIDTKEMMGKNLENLFKRIKESKIAIVVISSMYTESKWCLNELVEIKECAETMVVYPVFYKVKVETVKDLKGLFGDNFRDLVKRHPQREEPWKQALKFVTRYLGTRVEENSDEGAEVENIVENVKKILKEIPGECRREIQRARESEFPRGGREAEPKTPSDESQLFGLKTRVEQLKEKLELKSENVTRFVGVVGMPGIGKTTLAKKLFSECGQKFLHRMFLDDMSQKSEPFLDETLHTNLLLGLYKSKNYGSEGKGARLSLDSIKDQLKNSKVFVVLDNVSDKSQINKILGGRDWIKAGSKIVITTSSKSAIQGMVDSTYLVPGLSDCDALNHFNYHAFSGSDGFYKQSFTDLAKEFVDYSRGHPSVLKLLARELRNKDKNYWNEKLKALANSPSNTIQDVLRRPYDELKEQHKIVFLDIAYFFRFENESYVRSLLGSSAHADASEIKDLADKFLIDISGDRVEMSDLLYTFAMGLNSQASSENTTSGRRLSKHHEIVDVLMNKAEATKVRGIYLDMFEVRGMSLDSGTFNKMDDLRYLKFYNSQCHRECEPDDCKLNFPNGIEFLPQELRYLNWLKYPKKNLPKTFNPKNLIDLKLPYSLIEQIWEGEKDTSNLQWLDLNHSSKLHSLSGLSRAQKLQSINLEGCTGLKTLPQVLQNMGSLMFLNLRGCTSLESLPDITLVALRTLILSSCSSFKEFKLNAKKLEELYLDGTAIEGLPSTIGDLQRLISLKLKDCKKLLSLPDSIGNLKAIQEIILSGCSSLESFPEVNQNLKHLKTLLLDGTAIKMIPDQGLNSSQSNCVLCEWPRGIYGLSSVRRLSLSRNEIRILPKSIGYLYHLNWLDLKHCEKLVSVPMLPPNLQWLDAHGCISLEEISIPSDPLLAETEHLHSTFIFTNCTKLYQVEKNSIECYALKKIRLMSNAVARYEKVFALDVLIGICFPGWQVPLWFNHRMVGLELKQNLPRHWNAGGLAGIALCAVVSFQDYRSKNTRLLVTCSGEFKKADRTLFQFSCILGGWTEHGSYEPREIKSDHVFIGYTSWLHFMKRDDSIGCVATEVSLKFQVTDGTREVTNCTVVKCGFSLIYAPTNVDYSLCTGLCSDVIPSNSGGTSSGSTTYVRESCNQNGSEESYVPLVSPTIEIIEEAHTESFSDINQ